MWVYWNPKWTRGSSWNLKRENEREEEIHSTCNTPRPTPAAFCTPSACLEGTYTLPPPSPSWPPDTVRDYCWTRFFFPRFLSYIEFLNINRVISVVKNQFIMEGFNTEELRCCNYFCYCILYSFLGFCWDRHNGQLRYLSRGQTNTSFGMN